LLRSASTSLKDLPPWLEGELLLPCCKLRLEAGPSDARSPLL
jgi:hypothetical protein